MTLYPPSAATQLSTLDFFHNWRKAVENQPLKPRYRRTSIYYKVPSKREGRVGTRRNWKRKHPPRTIYIDLHSMQLTDSLGGLSGNVIQDYVITYSDYPTS
jgi:hypothetical protein